MMKKPSLLRLIGCEHGSHRFEFRSEHLGRLCFECKDCKEIYVNTRENIEKAEEDYIYSLLKLAH